MNKKLLILLTLTIFTIVKSDEFCRVLVLEGGGDRGAYHAGAFQQFVDQLNPEDVQYDIVTGISAGGLNAGAISFFEKGDEKSARDYLKNIWQTIRRENVWQTWSIFDDPLFNKQGLLDTSPLRAYLTNLVNQNEFKRNFTIGTTDLNTGNLLRLKLEDVPTKEDQVNMMMSTSAIPIVFPHISWRNTTFVDGGLDKLMDITGGVQWCKDQGYADNQIIVDAVLCLGSELNQNKDHSKDNTLQVLFRSLDVLVYNFLQSEIIQARDNYPNVNFRYLVIPPIFFDNDVFLLFTPSVVQAMYNSGINDAKEVINKGQGKSWDELYNKFSGSNKTLTQQQIEEQRMKVKVLKELFLQR